LSSQPNFETFSWFIMLFGRQKVRPCLTLPLREHRLRHPTALVCHTSARLSDCLVQDESSFIRHYTYSIYCPPTTSLLARLLRFQTQSFGIFGPLRHSISLRHGAFLRAIPSHSSRSCHLTKCLKGILCEYENGLRLRTLPAALNIKSCLPTSLNLQLNTSISQFPAESLIPS